MIFYVNSLLFTAQAMAAGGGLEKPTSFLQKIVDFLSSGPFAISVFTISLCIAAYRIAFNSATIRDVAPVFLAIIIIGCAPWAISEALG